MYSSKYENKKTEIEGQHALNLKLDCQALCRLIGPSDRPFFETASCMLYISQY